MHVTAILRILSILDVLPLLVSRWQGKKKRALRVLMLSGLRLLRLASIHWSGVWAGIPCDHLLQLCKPGMQGGEVKADDPLFSFRSNFSTSKGGVAVPLLARIALLSKNSVSFWKHQLGSCVLVLRPLAYWWRRASLGLHSLLLQCSLPSWSSP